MNRGCDRTAFQGGYRFTADVGDTGTGANVGPDGGCLIGSLTSGALFALDFSNRLFSINAGSGALSLLGAVPGLPTQDDAYIGNMTTSLNGVRPNLYYTLEVSSGPNTTGPTLFRIDPLTLAITSTALSAPSRIIGSGFVGGTLYAFTEFGEILTVNTATGATSLAALYDSGSTAANPGPPFTGLFGVVATPEPGTLVLTMGGLLLLGARARRGRTMR